jgi:hypothetical protein
MERVQHREHRCHTDARAHQDHRVCASVERELSARCRDFDAITDLDRGAKVSAGDSVRFDLDGDSVARAVRRSRQRVAAHEWRRAIARFEFERHELPRKRVRQRRAVVDFELHRKHGGGLRTLRDHPHGPEAGPRWWRPQGHQARVPAAWGVVALLLEERAERDLPAWAERGDPQCSLEQLGVGATVQVQQGVDGRD